LVRPVPFITAFTVISVIALVIVVILGNYTKKDPVVDLTLLGKTGTSRLALAALFFSFFGFILFSSTVLMPQLLQTLDKYGPLPRLGWRLTPGASGDCIHGPIHRAAYPRSSGAKRFDFHWVSFLFF